MKWFDTAVKILIVSYCVAALVYTLFAVGYSVGYNHGNEDGMIEGNRMMFKIYDDGKK